VAAEHHVLQEAIQEARLAAADALLAMQSARDAAAGVGSTIRAVAGEAARRIQKAAIEQAFGSQAGGSYGSDFYPGSGELLAAADDEVDGLFAPIEPTNALQEQSLIERAIASAFERM